MPDRIENIFAKLSEACKQPDWKGCGFIRAAVELAERPGHPAFDVARRYKESFTAWLQSELEKAGYESAEEIAQMIMILIDGAIARMLVHRDPKYALTAGRVAVRMLEG